MSTFSKDVIADWKLAVCRLIVQSGKLYTTHFKPIVNEYDVDLQTVRTYYANVSRRGFSKAVQEQLEQEMPSLLKKGSAPIQVQWGTTEADQPAKQPAKQPSKQPAAKPTAPTETQAAAPADQPADQPAVQPAPMPKYDPAKFDTKWQAKPQAKPTHPINSYKVGTTLQVSVTRVEAYGAICETTDGHYTPGLIHITRIRDQFVTDVHKWFKVGQFLTVQIVNVDKNEGRLGLSTKGLPLQEHGIRKDFAEQLLDIKEKIVPTGNEVAASVEMKPIAAPIKKEGTTNMDKEWQEAKRFIETIIGQVTPEAEVQFRSLMSTHGVFPFTMTLMGLVDSFKPDPGLMLALSILAQLDQPRSRL